MTPGINVVAETKEDIQDKNVQKGRNYEDSDVYASQQSSF